MVNLVNCFRDHTQVNDYAENVKYSVYCHEIYRV
jgi:hypothetical protein